MRFIPTLLLILAFTSCSPVMAQPSPDITLSPSHVSRVYDGDTIFFNLPLVPALFGSDIGIRARGYDTPEVRSYCNTQALKALEREHGFKARDRVRELVENAKYITLENPERGKFFRVVATIKIDGEDLGELLIEEGLALPYDGGARPGWCEKLSE